MQNFELKLEELEEIAAPGAWEDFANGFAVGFGIVGTAWSILT